MTILRFLFGENIATKKPTESKGTIYLDCATKELWYDDPKNGGRNKIRNTDNIFIGETQPVEVNFPENI